MNPIAMMQRAVLLSGLTLIALCAGCGGAGSSGGGSGSEGAPAISIAAGDGENVLTLTPPSGAAAGAFNLYWSTSPQVTIATGTKIAGVTSPFSHTGLTNGIPLFYIGAAVVGGGESPPSAVVGGMPGKWVQPLQPCAPPCASPPARDSHTAVYNAGADRMIVFGGRGANQPLNDFWILENAATAAPSWNGPVAANAPPGRVSHTAAYNDPVNRMFVFGGALNSDGTSLTNELWAVSNADASAGPPQWSLLAQSGPSPRWGHAAVYDSANDEMIVFGGSTQTGQGLSNEVWVLDRAMTFPGWRQITTSGGPSARCCMAAAYDAAGRRMILFGGFGGFGQTGAVLFGDLWTLTFDAAFSTAAWREFTPSGGTAPTARCCGVSLWDGGKLLLFGGGQFGSPFDDKIHALLLQSGAFASADGPGGGPVARTFPAAVPAGPFLLFGGSGASGPLNDLWRLN